jgi:hypothetical protein
MFSRSFLSIVLMLALLLNGHGCIAVDICACSPTTYTFIVFFKNDVCPATSNPPSGTGIADVTCEGEPDVFSTPLTAGTVTFTEVAIQGTINTEVSVWNANGEVTYTSSVKSIFTPQSLKIQTQVPHSAGMLIDSTLTITFTNACTGEPALQNFQDVGFYRLVGNSLSCISWYLFHFTVTRYSLSLLSLMIYLSFLHWSE